MPRFPRARIAPLRLQPSSGGWKRAAPTVRANLGAQARASLSIPVTEHWSFESSALSLSRESGSGRPAQGPGLVQSTGRWEVGRAGIGGMGETVLLLPSRSCWWCRCDFCTSLCFQSLSECRYVNENKDRLLLWIGVETKGMGKVGKGVSQNIKPGTKSSRTKATDWVLMPSGGPITQSSRRSVFGRSSLKIAPFQVLASLPFSLPALGGVKESQPPEGKAREPWGWCGHGGVILQMAELSLLGWIKA